MTQLHHFQAQKVKCQGHQTALLSAALTRKVAAAVSVGMCSAWGKYCYVASARRRRGAWAPTGEERGGGILSPRAQLVTLSVLVSTNLFFEASMFCCRYYRADMDDNSK